jgi:RND family efflux transporter MFP subunit
VRVPQEESAVGTIQAVHETSLGSKLLAKVTAVHVKAGQPVTKGKVLIELDDADLKARRQQAAAAVEAARARRDQARIEYDRVQRLIQQGAATRLEQDQVANLLKAAEATLQQAQQGLAEADTIFGYAKIVSPLDGLVVDKKVEVGDTVQPGQPLVKLYDPTRMQIVARVRESLAQRLQVGKLIPVQIDALDLKCHGLISEIVPEADSTSRTFSVKVTGPCPPGVYAGMFARLMIPIDELEMLVIPSDAVRRIGQVTTVEVAEQGVLRRRSVQLGRDVDGKVQVLSGLREGEQVAVPVPASQAVAKGA